MTPQLSLQQQFLKIYNSGAHVYVLTVCSSERHPLIINSFELPSP